MDLEEVECVPGGKDGEQDSKGAVANETAKRQKSAGSDDHWIVSTTALKDGKSH
jgi:hypothetical protein